MWILTIFLLLIGIGGLYIGSKEWFTIDRLNKTNVLNGALAILIFFTMLMVAFVLGYFPQSIAAPFMMTGYSIIGGFFIGYAYRLFSMRGDAGHSLYQQRSFWIDHAPNLLAAALIIYGIFRTSILTEQPVTGIRLTSGISLMSFGFYCWTLNVVPEFRSRGIIFLDRFIHWREVVAWDWLRESVLKIEYILETENKEESLSQFLTSIPEEERKEVETILKSKMDEYIDFRRKRLIND